MIKLLISLIIFVWSAYLLNKLLNRIVVASKKTKKEKPDVSVSKYSLRNDFNELIKNPKSKQALRLKFICFIIGFAVISLITGKFIVGAAIGSVFFFIPGVIADLVIQNNLKIFNSQLIDALNIASGALRAGASLSQAIDIIVQNTKPPLSVEFGMMANEIKVGISVDKALLSLASRVKSRDLNLFVTTVNIARETGGKLAEIFDTISEAMRERNKIQGKIDSLTAQGKMSGIVIGAMPFVLMLLLYFIAPEMISPLFDTLNGNLMIGVVIIMVAIGGYMIKKIVTIDI